mgnify:CR=1 FL=1
MNINFILRINYIYNYAYYLIYRDCYEAFLLFTFFYLIFAYIAFDEET